MAAKVKVGDKVEWGTSQGKTKGVVKKKVTSPMKIKGHEVKASKDNPQYLVESSKTGEKAAHKAEALKKTSAKKASKKSTSKKSSGAASAKKKSPTAKKKSSGSSSAKTSKRTSTAKKTSRSKDDDDQVIKDFKQMVNLAPKTLEKWLDTAESKKVGFKDDGKGESVGHESGAKILKILAKRKDKYTDDDVKHIHKVVGYIKRHLAQKPKGDISASNWRYSLMNWGHDPTK